MYDGVDYCFKQSPLTVLGEVHPCRALAGRNAHVSHGECHPFADLPVDRTRDILRVNLAGGPVTPKVPGVDSCMFAYQPRGCETIQAGCRSVPEVAGQCLQALPRRELHGSLSQASSSGSLHERTHEGGAT